MSSILKRNAKTVERKHLPWQYVTVCTSEGALCTFPDALGFDMSSGEGIVITLEDGIVGFPWNGVRWWQISEDGKSHV